MRRVLLLIVLSFLIMGCSKKSIQTIDTSTWKHIVDKEWSNFDSFAGSGFYFYEEDSVGYCVYMIYGSGLPVIYEYTSKVEIKEEGLISIKLPENILISDSNNNVIDKDKTVVTYLEFNDGVIKYGDMEFKNINDSFNRYDDNDTYTN
ncbi:hypothetical protein I5677_02015 [Mobilitalea sibirica]|uniref:Lipoprotein n=1 Tax=Mobilitalea sibirica TaxID=1462919 RepID=A0A8J7HB72_9FIRM|nr:hypothetical protein [Mobilitalea sibirica]MBH1939667.1 hypothetical protein [Mobilitalea sibirica]